MAYSKMTEEEFRRMLAAKHIKFIEDTDELYKKSLDAINDYKAATFGLRPIPIKIKDIDFVKAFDRRTTNPWAVVKLNNEKENEKMDAKKCDRCGKLFETKDAEKWIKVPFAFYLDDRTDKEDLIKKYTEEYLRNEFLNRRVRITTDSDNGVEFCPECRQAFANWWEMGATRTTKE